MTFVTGGGNISKLAYDNATEAKLQAEAAGTKADSAFSFVAGVYLDPVATFADIATTYPNPTLNDKVFVTDTGKYYLWNETEWHNFAELTPEPFNQISAELAEITKLIVSIDKYPKFSAETTDSPRIIRACNDVSSQGGGVILFPFGNYDIDLQHKIPSSVVLAGQKSKVNKGKMVNFKITHGVNPTDPVSDATFVLNVGSGLIDIGFEYPNQVLSSSPTPTPYSWTVSTSKIATGSESNTDGVLLENLFFKNSYCALDLTNAAQYTARNIQGNPLYRGLLVEQMKDVSRIENVHWFPFHAPMNTLLFEFVKNNAIAFEFANCDHLITQGLFAFGYYKTFKFSDFGNGGPWVELNSALADHSTYPFDFQAGDIIHINGGTFIGSYHNKPVINTGTGNIGTIHFNNVTMFGVNNIGGIIENSGGTYLFSNTEFKNRGDTDDIKTLALVVTSNASVKISNCKGIEKKLFGGETVVIDGIKLASKGAEIGTSDLYFLNWTGNVPNVWGMTNATGGTDLSQITNGVRLNFVADAGGATRTRFIDYTIGNEWKRGINQFILELELKVNGSDKLDQSRFYLKEVKSDGSDESLRPINFANGFPFENGKTIKLKVPFMYPKQTGGTRVYRLEWQAYGEANFTVDITNIKFHEISRSTSANYLDYMKQIYGEALVGGRLENENVVIVVDNAPSFGKWKKGDVVINSNPTELGTAGSKYIVEKWICTVGDGTGIGTWLPCRTLTGN
ncbi:hypothetical protein AB3Z07_21140 [Metabacillus halosaccharovorans]|uniref:hypothetical protein n=1 Tax=Metabacillus halosaccharovorans TaxID=930124 RepID=UPI0034CFE73F